MGKKNFIMKLREGDKKMGRFKYVSLFCAVLTIFLMSIYAPFGYATPFTPRVWKQEVQTGPLAGQKKHINWINDQNPQNFIDDRIDGLPDSDLIDIVITFNKGFYCTEIQETLSSYGTDLYISKFLTFATLRDVKKSDVAQIASHPDVAMVELALPGELCLNVSTSTINSTDANNLGFTGSGVNIAIIDSGVDEGHDAFTGKTIEVYDPATDSFTNPDDGNGHGTHVAGIALGTDWTDYSSGGEFPPSYRGVAPDAGLIDIKVTIGDSGSVSLDFAVKGLEMAMEKEDDWNIKVINMSFVLGGSYGYTDGDDAFSQLTDLAVDRGIVVVCAAGNDGGPGFPPPAASSLAITVAGSDDHNSFNIADDTIAGFSNNGPRADDGDGDPLDELKPDIAAPGADILSAATGTTYEVISKSGTSMAAPHVAGVAALILEASPTMNPGSVKELLKQTAVRAPTIPGMDDNPGQDSTDDPDYDTGSGNGLVDALAALNALGLGAEVKFPSCIGGTCDGERCLLSSDNESPPCWLNETDIRLDIDPIVDGVPNVIRVDVTNSSATVNAIGVKINIGAYYYTAGIKTFHEIGSHVRDIDAGDTITVSQPWTPDTGHRCIKVSIDYGSDTDFSNNVTQRNIDVQATSSPAVFTFNVENPLTEPKIIELAPLIDIPGWTVTLEPRRFRLDPFVDCPVSVTATLDPTPPLTPAEPISGEGKILLGGVSLRAIDETAGTATCHIYAYAKDMTENMPPVADAGPDRTVYADEDDLAEISLDASGSCDPDGDSLTYEWSWTGGTASGVNPSVILPVGETTITLTASDGLDMDTDRVVITVKEKKKVSSTEKAPYYYYSPPTYNYFNYSPVQNIVMPMTTPLDTSYKQKISYYSPWPTYYNGLYGLYGGYYGGYSYFPWYTSRYYPYKYPSSSWTYTTSETHSVIGNSPYIQNYTFGSNYSGGDIIINNTVNY